MSVLFIFLAIFLILTFSSFLTLCSGYGSYKKVYKSLKQRKFYRNRSQVYSHEFNKKDDGFVWFLDDNHFALEKNIYLHASFITFLDPYSFYWLIKYRRWFKENIDLNNIEEY